MGSPPDSAAPCRQVYVLTVWRATSATPWRAALRPTGSQERIGLADLETLALFLLAWTTADATGDVVKHRTDRDRVR